MNPVIPDAAGLLEAVQRAIEFEDLAGVLAVVDAFRYAHVQFLLECAVEVRLVDVGLMDMKAVAGGKSKEDTDRGELDHGREHLAEVDIWPLGESLCDEADLVIDR